MPIDDLPADDGIQNYLSDKKSLVLKNDKCASLSNFSSSIKELTEVIASNCFLECLDISNCKLSDLQIAAVATALSKTHTLRELNLSYNEIGTDNTALKVASVITGSLSLMKINLNNCHLQESGVVIIADALAKIKSLVCIDMSS